MSLPLGHHAPPSFPAPALELSGVKVSSLVRVERQPKFHEPLDDDLDLETLRLYVATEGVDQLVGDKCSKIALSRYGIGHRNDILDKPKSIL